MIAQKCCRWRSSSHLGYLRKNYRLFFCPLLEAWMLWAPRVCYPPSHAAEPKRMESPEPWSRNLKAENRNHGILARRYQDRLPGFPVSVGASPPSCNSPIISKVSCSWLITTANPNKHVNSIWYHRWVFNQNLFSILLKVCHKHAESYTSLDPWILLCITPFSILSFTVWNRISEAVAIKLTQIEFLRLKKQAYA